MEKTTSQQFYKAWSDTVQNRKEEYLKVWRNARQTTDLVKDSKNSIIVEVAQKLDLLCYNTDYYSLDAILYKEEDKTPHINPNNYWFRDIRVVFEHENVFTAGLFQEVSHLLITNCDLRVLVTYPDRAIESELDYLHEIISGNRQSKTISDDESFLIIFGYEKGFLWEGFIYKEDNNIKWKKF